MPKKELKKTIFEQTEAITDMDTGAVVEKKVLHTYIESREPDYVKLYLNTILASKDLPITNNKVLNALLKRMTYANSEEENGGQIVIINEYVRSDIAKEVNQKMDTVKKTIMKFAKAGLINNIARGTYQVNPHIFGKGDWSDIKGIRAKFSFGDTDEQMSLFESDIKD